MYVCMYISIVVRKEFSLSTYHNIYVIQTKFNLLKVHHLGQENKGKSYNSLKKKKHKYEEYICIGITKKSHRGYCSMLFTSSYTTTTLSFGQSTLFHFTSFHFASASNCCQCAVSLSVSVSAQSNHVRDSLRIFAASNKLHIAQLIHFEFACIKMLLLL